MMSDVDVFYYESVLKVIVLVLYDQIYLWYCKRQYCTQ